MTTTTWYGGMDTSYAEIGGLAIKGVFSPAHSDRAETVALTALRDPLNNPVTQVQSAANGHYFFGVDDYNGPVFLNFGNGVFQVDPADLSTRLIAAEAALAALAGAGPTLSFSDGGTWAPTTTYTAGAFRYEPDGSRRVVDTTYTSGATYDLAGVDTANSQLVTPAPFSQTLADGLYAPLSGAFQQMVFWDGGALTPGFDFDPNGVDMPGTENLNQIALSVDLPPFGSGAAGDCVAKVYRLVPTTNVEVLVGTFAILNGQVSSITPLSRTVASCGTSTGSPVVTCAAAFRYDQGFAISGAGIPSNTYVGTVISNTSYRLSSSPTSQIDVNATATATITATIGAAFTVAKKDKLAIRVTQPAGAVGLKARVLFGSETAASVTAPGAAGTLANPSSTANSATVTWVQGSNSTQSIVYRGNADGTNMQPYWNVGTLTTFTDMGPLGTGLTTGEVHAYGIAARRYTAITAPVGFIVAGTGGASFDLLPNAGGDGALDSSKATATIGSGVTGSPVIVTGGKLLLTGGVSSSSNNVNDQVNLLMVADPTLHTGWFANVLGHPTTAASLWAVYLESTALSASGTANKGLQFQIGQSRIRIGGHFGAFDPTVLVGGVARGSGSAGSFQNLTDPAYPTNMVSGYTRDSNGGVLLPSVLSLTVDTGFRFEALAPSGGQQVVNLKVGTAAQYGAPGGTTAAAMPTLATVTLPSAWVSGLAPGSVFSQVLGILTASTPAYQVSISDLAWGALTVAGV